MRAAAGTAEPPLVERMATKNTGNYLVHLVVLERSRDVVAFGVSVTYTGPYAGGEEVILAVDTEDDGVSEEEVREWFAELRGDFDVAELLAEAGFDEYGSALSRGRR